MLMYTPLHTYTHGSLALVLYTRFGGGGGEERREGGGLQQARSVWIGRGEGSSAVAILWGTFSDGMAVRLHTDR